MSNLGKSLHDIRKEKDVSKSELSRVTGISFGTIGRYERGETYMSVENVEAILDYLGYKLEVVEK